MEVIRGKNAFFTNYFPCELDANTDFWVGPLGPTDTDLIRIFYIIVKKNTILPNTVNFIVGNENNVKIPLTKIALDQGAATLYTDNISGANANVKVFYFPKGIVLGGYNLQLGLNHNAAGTCNVEIFGEVIT